MVLDSLNLIWIDLEMTGLDPQNDFILEIATVVTDKDLNVIAEGPELVIHQDEAVLASMDQWNQEHHGQSGLIERVNQSGITERGAEQQTLGFLQQWVPSGSSPICGNSICQDRRFLYRCMPKLEEYFHYRNLDISTIKELMQRWAPSLNEGFKKKSSHRAMDDILESIDELKYYREHFFR